MLEFEHEVAVKVCGITNTGDALACAAAGADMLGLNFSPRSLRCIGMESASEIVTEVRARFPRIKLVGVFVNQDSAVVQKIAADLALDAVQLHGEESPDYVGELAQAFVVAGGVDPGRSRTRARQPPPGSTPPATTFVINALRVSDAFSAANVSAYQCDAILLDAWDRSMPGGTGRTFPWTIAAALRPQVARLILAGGLTNENVAEAIRVVEPCAVDVCSGVEAARGRKDENKVRAFIEAVHAAFAP